MYSRYRGRKIFVCRVLFQGQENFYLSWLYKGSFKQGGKKSAVGKVVMADQHKFVPEKHLQVTNWKFSIRPSIAIVIILREFAVIWTINLQTDRCSESVPGSHCHTPLQSPRLWDKWPKPSDQCGGRKWNLVLFLLHRQHSERLETARPGLED